MRENRTHGSEGGETGKTTGLSYPYKVSRTFGPVVNGILSVLSANGASQLRPGHSPGYESQRDRAG